jgi:hypothetical protein
MYRKGWGGGFSVSKFESVKGSVLSGLCNVVRARAGGCDGDCFVLVLCEMVDESTRG